MKLNSTDERNWRITEINSPYIVAIFVFVRYTAIGPNVEGLKVGDWYIYADEEGASDVL